MLFFFKKRKKKKIIGKTISFAITKYNKHACCLCGVRKNHENDLFLLQSINGIDFEKTDRLEVFSDNNKKQKLENCSNYSFLIYANGEHYLTYLQSVHNKKQLIVARSRGDGIFEVVKKSDHAIKELSIVSNFKYKNRFLAYYADNSIYAAASSNLTDWHFSGALLSPRRDHFDEKPLNIIGTAVTEKGILLIYGSKNANQKSGILKIGAALFSLDKPYNLIWRSNLPIWEKNIKKDIFPEKFTGIVAMDEMLHIYWVSSDDKVFSITIDISACGLIETETKKVVKLIRHSKNPIIIPKNNSKWESSATFNPAAICLGNKIHLLYRAIGENGLSVFGYASSSDGINIDERSENPVFVAMKIRKKTKMKSNVNSFGYFSGGSWIGCEDPRLTHIDDRIFMTYVSFDGQNPPGVALTSISVRDFLHKVWKWKHPVLISKPGEIQKNWMLFPEKINGKYAILHSITPKIAIDYLDNINDKNIVIESRKLPGIDELRWDNMVRGAGAPPIKTKHGWLVFYHAMDKRDPDKYKVGAMILDYNDPTKILYRSKHPILEPIAHYENNGAKSGVVYVCGAVIKGDTLFVYYGGSDSVVCVATINVDEFLGDLTREIVNENINDSKKKRKRKKRINRKKSNNNKKKKIKNKN